MAEPQLLVAIVGKRNAGKSTLVNALARIYEDDPQRVIVSEVPARPATASMSALKKMARPCS